MFSQRPVAMSSESENKLSTASAALETPAATPECAARDERSEGAEEQEPARDQRLDRLPLQLDVMVKVRSFQVGDLLALSRGSVVETVHEHAQDVPVRSGGVVLVWAEFEVVEQRLAVRITRLG